MDAHSNKISPGAESVEVSIITVNYKVADLVDELVDSIEKYPPSFEWEMIIVDNDSGGDDPQKLNGLVNMKDNIKLVLSNNNGGFGAGNNLGVENSSGKYLIFLNPDMVVEEGSLTTLIEHLKECSVCGIVAPRVNWSDDSFQPSARSYPNLLTGLFGRQTILSKLFPNNPFTKKQLLDLEHATEPAVIEWAAGMAIGVRKEEFLHVGAWDEKDCMDWEDADLSLRYRKDLNLITHYIPTVQVKHYHSQSATRLGSRATRVFHDSAFYYVRKNLYPSPMDPRRWLSWLALRLRMTAVIIKKSLKK